MKFADFEYRAPRTPAEVVRLLAERPGEAKIIAGGQSLLPTMAYRLAQPALLVDLKDVPGLDGIRLDGDVLRLGARTRWRDIEASALLATAHPLLQEAVRHVAHYQVRNRGTVGGSLAHGDPASELPCIAVTCQAELRVLGPAGERRIAADGFFIGPLTTTLRDDEMILELVLPAWQPRRRWAFLEFARRSGDFALAGVALYYDPDASGRATNVHIGVVGACQRPHRLAAAEAALTGRVPDEQAFAAAAAAAAAESDPPNDLQAPAAYRKALVGTLLQRALQQAVARAARPA